jgi:predicted RNA methylase
MSIFDNKDFYPTPSELVHLMASDLDLYNKIVLEPSAGNGNIIEVLSEYSPKEIIVCELNDDFAKICSQKSDRFLKNDFLKVTKDEVSHIDYILMNPPFSKDEEHILHAWEIAPEGSEIVSLCNWETIDNYSYRKRRILKGLIRDHGNSEKLGNVFSTAERKTDVEVGLVHLYKPRITEETEFEGYFDLSEEYEDSENEGIMSYNAIRDIVNRYVAAVKMFDSVIEKNSEINNLIHPISNTLDIYFGAYRRQGSIYSEIKRDDFKKELQKSSWKSVFMKLKMDKYVTNSVMEDINKFVEKQTAVPFTMNNIYKMMEMIIGTHSQRMERVIVEAFDRITQHYHSNRYQKEGWKTNSEYRVNKKFILESNQCSHSHVGTAESSYEHGRGYFMDDLTKALCYVTGSNYNECDDWWNFMNNNQKYDKPYKYPHPENPGEFIEGSREERKNFGREWGKWHVFNFVKFKVYKKGSIHCEFLSEDVWNKFNQIACKAKGFQLASKFTSDFRKKETGVEIYN